MFRRIFAHYVQLYGFLDETNLFIRISKKYDLSIPYSLLFNININIFKHDRLIN